jgi:hypothetical protein
MIFQPGKQTFASRVNGNSLMNSSVDDHHMITAFFIYHSESLFTGQTSPVFSSVPSAATSFNGQFFWQRSKLFPQRQDAPGHVAHAPWRFAPPSSPLPLTLPARQDHLQGCRPTAGQPIPRCWREWELYLRGGIHRPDTEDPGRGRQTPAAAAGGGSGRPDHLRCIPGR